MPEYLPSTTLDKCSLHFLDVNIQLRTRALHLGCIPLWVMANKLHVTTGHNISFLIAQIKGGGNCCGKLPSWRIRTSCVNSVPHSHDVNDASCKAGLLRSLIVENNSRLPLHYYRTLERLWQLCDGPDERCNRGGLLQHTKRHRQQHEANVG